METLELKKFLRNVGESVHSMNTIAVALSLLPDDEIQIPKGLTISWSPKNIYYSKKKARNFAERSVYVYAAESLFEYLGSISKNPFWSDPNVNFKGEEKKAIRVYNFFKQIPDISEPMAILSELLCHWRNRIVHLNTSNARLSQKQMQLILSHKDNIYSQFHHFDVQEALQNFENKKVTLKDTSTLVTITIKCARLVDSYFFNKMIKNIDVVSVKEKFLTRSDFEKIYKQMESEKRNRQLKKWLEVNFPFLAEKKAVQIFNTLKR